MAACDDMMSVNASFGGPTMQEINMTSMQQTAIFRTQSELELEFNPTILVADTSDEEDTVRTQNPSGTEHVTVCPSDMAQDEQQTGPASLEGRDGSAMELAVTQGEDKVSQPVEAADEDILGPAPPGQVDAAMQFGNGQEDEGTQPPATAAEESAASVRNSSTQELTEIHSSSFNQRELLAQLQSRVSAWKEECQSVSSEELWQLHAAANDFGADAEALRLLGLDIVSLESRVKEGQQSTNDSSDRHDAATSLEPANAAADVMDDLPTPHDEHAQKDMSSGQGQLREDSSPQAKPDCGPSLAADLVTALDAEIASDSMNAKLPSDSQVAEPQAGELFTVLPVDDAVNERPSGNVPPTVLPIVDTVTEHLSGNVQPQPQGATSRWFSCLMCSRRSQQPSKRKAESDAEVLMEAAKKQRTL